MLRAGRGLPEYICARAARIYLPYLPVGAGLLALYIAFPSISAGNRQVGVFTSLTLLPSDLAPALSVAWTLAHELLFYTILGTSFFSRRLARLLLGAWFVFIVYTCLFVDAHSVPVLALAGKPVNLWFFAGMGLRRLPAATLSTTVAALLALLALAATLAMAAAALPKPVTGIGFCALVYLSTRTSLGTLHPGRGLLFAGAASYSVYLVHNPVQSMLARLPPFTEPSLGSAGYFAGIAMGSLLAGLVYHQWYERPAIRLSRDWIKRRFGPGAD